MNEFLTAAGTVLGIASVQFLRDYRDGKSLFKRNGAYENAQVIKKILESQSQLKEHYNDETTDLLRGIKEGIDKLNQKHENYEIIGIKTRDCAKEL